MSGGSLDYFFSKEPDPHRESRTLEKIKKIFEEHLTDIPLTEYKQILKTMDTLIDLAKKMENAYEDYFCVKTTNFHLLLDIEWALSGDIDFKDIPRNR